MLLELHSFVIQRRILQPLGAVRRGLADRTPLGPIRLHDLDPDGFLQIDEPFRPVRSLLARQPAPTWCTSARLLNDRRRVVAVIEIELSMWSHDSTELQLRPVARHPERWSSRRVGRYFAIAHRGADATAQLVAQRAATAIEALAAEPVGAQRTMDDRVGSYR